jgi:hypothetical protein
MQNQKGRQGNEGERRLQREVLALVLVEHPVRLTLGEAQKVLGRPIEVEGAVVTLVAGELLAWEGEEIVPTEAALRFNELEPIDPPGDA